MAKTYLSDLLVENIAEAGSYSFNNNANLSETMPNTSYSVFMTGTTDARPFTVESKTTTTFVINTNSNQAMTGTVDWQVIAHGAL